jgi:hypothetical protein
MGPNEVNEEKFDEAFRNAYVNFTYWVVTKDPMPEQSDLCIDLALFPISINSEIQAIACKPMGLECSPTMLFQIGVNQLSDSCWEHSLQGISCINHQRFGHAPHDA